MKRERIELETAFVLHTRPYTDSRRLVELFTRGEGRIGAVARSQNKAARFNLLRPFQPLLVSWRGRTELKSLTHYESAAAALPLAGTDLYCGFYLNELLVRLLANGDPHEDLFDTYAGALARLAHGNERESVLRAFELELLQELGYGIAFDAAADSGEALDPERLYRFDPAAGFSVLLEGDRRRVPAYRGDVVLAVGERRFDDAAVRQAAKLICREALQVLLGDKPLRSRELFSSGY